MVLAGTTYAALSVAFAALLVRGLLIRRGFFAQRGPAFGAELFAYALSALVFICLGLPIWLTPLAAL